MPGVYNIVQYSPDNSNWFQVRNTSITGYYSCVRAASELFPEDSFDFLVQSLVSLQYVVPTELIYDQQDYNLQMRSKRHILPMAVRYVDKSQSYYIERPPCRINVKYKNARASHSAPEVEDLFIWVPWTITIMPVTFINKYDPGDVRIYYSHSALSSSTQMYINSLFPNTHSDARICWSGSFSNLLTHVKDQSDFNTFDYRYWHSMIFNDYMLGGWNNDLISRPLYALSGRTNVGEAGIVNQILEGDYKSKYPLVDMYRNPQSYPEFYDRLVSVVINKFNFSRSKALDVVSNAQYDSYISNYDYVKLLSFMSLLSLEETLSFYKQIGDVVKDVEVQNKKNSKNKKNVYSLLSCVAQKFSEVVKEYCADIEFELLNQEDDRQDAIDDFDSDIDVDLDEDLSFSPAHALVSPPNSVFQSQSVDRPTTVGQLGLCVQDPIVKTVAANDPRCTIEKASSYYSNYTIVYLFKNISRSQVQKMDVYKGDDVYHVLESQGFDLVPVMEFYSQLKNQNSTTFFVHADCKEKTYTFYTKEDLTNYYDNFKADLLARIDGLADLKSPSKSKSKHSKNNKHLVYRINEVMNYIKVS